MQQLAARKKVHALSDHPGRLVRRFCFAIPWCITEIFCTISSDLLGVSFLSIYRSAKCIEVDMSSATETSLFFIFSVNVSRSLKSGLSTNITSKIEYWGISEP